MNMDAPPPPDDRADIIERAIRQAVRLATLPEVTARLLEVVENPDATATDIEGLIATDPVLSVRVLKVVNSPFYGLRAPVQSIAQATVMLGLNGIRNIAIAASLARLFRGGEFDASFSAQALWTNSMAVAAGARLIGERVGADGDELFLMGMLHDVGIMVALQAFPQTFGETLRAVAGSPELRFRDAERRILGVTHEELGLAICREWHFPETIQHAVGYHHDPEAAPCASRQPVAIVCLADHLAARAGVGYVAMTRGEALPDSVLAQVGLHAQALEDIGAQLSDAAGLAAAVAP